MDWESGWSHYPLGERRSAYVRSLSMAGREAGWPGECAVTGLQDRDHFTGSLKATVTTVRFEWRPFALLHPAPRHVKAMERPGLSAFHPRAADHRRSIGVGRLGALKFRVVQGPVVRKVSVRTPFR